MHAVIPRGGCSLLTAQPISTRRRHAATQRGGMRGGMAPSRGRLTSGQGPSRLAGAGIGAWGARAPRANGFPPLWRWASATASPPFCVAASLTHTLGACGMDASASACAAADAAARAPAVALTASCASDACAGVAVATFIAEATAAKSAMAKPPWPEKRSARRERAQRRMVAEGGGQAKRGSAGV